MIHLMIEEGVRNHVSVYSIHDTPNDRGGGVKHVSVYNIHDTPNDRGGSVKPCVCI